MVRVHCDKCLENVFFQVFTEIPCILPTLPKNDQNLLPPFVHERILAPFCARTHTCHGFILIKSFFMFHNFL